MGVIHHKESSLKIIVPPKCGTALVSALCEYTEYLSTSAFGFYEEETQHFAPTRDNVIFVVRNHFSRVLSTYYEKIVDPHGSDEDSWRRLKYEGPKAYGARVTYCSFYNFLCTLGQAHSWDDHIAPYFTFDWFSYPWLQFRSGLTRAIICPTSQIDQILPMVNELLELPKDTGRERWEENKKKLSDHKIPYTDNLPSPERYGASAWSRVELEGLYQCYLDTGALPTARVMYSDVYSRTLIYNQIGYQRDEKIITDLFNPGAGLMDVPQ